MVEKKRVELSTEDREAFVLKEWRPLVEFLRMEQGNYVLGTVNVHGDGTEELTIEIEGHGLTIELGEIDRSTIAGVRVKPAWRLSETRVVCGGHWEPDDYDLVELSTHQHWQDVVREVLIVIATREIDGLLETRAEAEYEARQKRNWEGELRQRFGRPRCATAVNVHGEFIPTDQVEFLDCSEGVQGEDVLKFRYNGKTYERTVVSR